MTERVLVDSDILIDVSRGISATTGLLSTTTQTARILISAVVQMELLVGCRNQSERQITERFLSRFEVVDINESISKRAVYLLTTYNFSHGLLIPDALIAATALVIDVPLLSKNQRDYRVIENLNLLPFSI